MNKILALFLLIASTTGLSAQTVFEFDSSDVAKIDYLIDRNEYLEAQCASQEEVIKVKDNGLQELRDIIVDLQLNFADQENQLTACRNAPKQITVQESFSILKAIGVAAIGVVIGFVVAFLVKVN